MRNPPDLIPKTIAVTVLGPSLRNLHYVATLTTFAVLVKLMPKQLQPLLLMGLAMITVSFGGTSGSVVLLAMIFCVWAGIIIGEAPWKKSVVNPNPTMKERLVGLKTLAELEGKEKISKGIQRVLAENYGYAKKPSQGSNEADPN